MSSFQISRLLRSPGSGLLSFTSGSEKAARMLGKYFSAELLNDWQASLEHRISATAALPFGIIGVPSDCGGGICRGTAHGPLHIREQLYQDHPDWVSRDIGDVPCIPHLLHDSMLNDAQLKSSGEALWGDEFKAGWPVSPLSLLEELLVELFQRDSGFRPLVLGGDHSIAGAIFAALRRAGKLADLAVLQIDAHTDLLETRYGVRHCFATWTAHAVRDLPDPGRWVQVGIRASGHDQAHWEGKFGLKQIWADSVLESDPDEFAAELIARWKELGCRRLYISNDIDGVSKEFAPSTGTPEPNGLTPEWTNRVLKLCSEALPLVGYDVPEVAPVLGSCEDGLLTVRTAVDAIRSLNWI